MSSFLDEVSDQLNLRWAWDKVQREALPGDIWFDAVELAAFDLQLKRNLQSIATEFRKGRYRIKPLRPLPFPKHPDADGNPRVRQAFQVAVRDQVAWTAIVNIVGQYVDGQMPAWSYGHRLFRRIWVEQDEDGRKQRNIGPYRNASGRLYLGFGQSWPIFRRHVYLTTRAMMAENDGLPEMDERTEDEAALQERLASEHRCPFVVPAHWNSKRPEKPELYWCSIDLEKFYPTMSLGAVRNNIVDQLPSHFRNEATELLGSMLDFRLDTTDWTASDLKEMDLPSGQKNFPHIPTGLYVAGFLANAGLLAVDLEVQRRLTDRRVAHFRFVDDHVILAYNLDELTQWVMEYRELLDSMGTGTRINPDKVEPKELAFFFNNAERPMTTKNSEAIRKAADSACHLDPQFPSPLMTKTLALVSGIARIDFNLLESGELAALTDQLEHLLLVDLSEDEIPVKTRLSFAATRLTRIAECRLANDEVSVRLHCREESLDAELRKEKLTLHPCKELIDARLQLDVELRSQENVLMREVKRAFQLLRKVLRERPDRIRLWTRAVIMCRLTGVGGISYLLDDIRREKEKNPLAGEYLQANLLLLLGSQVLIAARILKDGTSAYWRKRAALAFLMDVQTSTLPPELDGSRWFLRISWSQYCLGLYCAMIVLKDIPAEEMLEPEISFSSSLINVGKQFATNGGEKHAAAQWAWWASRMTLRDLAPHADNLVNVLGKALSPSKESTAYWQFFPLDVPMPVLEQMVQAKGGAKENAPQDGWWFDALRTKQLINDSLPLSQSKVIQKVRRVLELESRDTISLYDWCDHLRSLNDGQNPDPRSGEWSALEIVRQIGTLIDREPTFNDFVFANHSRRDSLALHPANFRIPKSWLLAGNDGVLTWSAWRELVRRDGPGNGVTCVSKKNRIVDDRYSPLSKDTHRLFVEVNPIRGMGLLLNGMLRKSFDLPAVWNGPGHADVLTMLPRMLLREMTCASSILGLLQSCLQPRVTENLLFRRVKRAAIGTVNNDSSHDPILLLSASDVVNAIAKCQRILEESQLSTWEHRARQLTPSDVGQLTDPDWSRVFDAGYSEGVFDG